MNLFKKGILSGIGLGLFAKEKIEEQAKKLAEEAKLSEKETQEFVEEIKKQAEKTRTQIDEKVQDQIKEAVDRLGLVTQEDLKRLEKKIDALQKSSGSKGPAKKSGPKKQEEKKEDTP